MSTPQQPEGTITLQATTVVHAPIERCFNLSCSIQLVEDELGMHPVSGRTGGLVTAGDTVLWKGWQLGLPQFHESLISAFDPPHFFQDTMLRGRFQYFQHDHRFTSVANGTLLHDELRYALPLGWLGNLVARTVMTPHIHRLMQSRFARIKRHCEGETWRDYIPADWIV